jgi:hypothetical protein
VLLDLETAVEPGAVAQAVVVVVEAVVAAAAVVAVVAAAGAVASSRIWLVGSGYQIPAQTVRALVTVEPEVGHHSVDYSAGRTADSIAVENSWRMNFLYYLLQLCYSFLAVAAEVAKAVEVEMLVGKASAAKKTVEMLVLPEEN